MKRSILLGLLSFLVGFSTPSLAQEHGSRGNSYPGPVSLSGLFYLAYQMGEEGGQEFSDFTLNRSYLTGRVNVLPRLSARITLDAHQDETGDMKGRIKYAYGKYDFGDAGGIKGLGLEGGIVHMVWLDFEEHINLYRMRDQMFMERSGMFNSADFGATLTGGLGENLPAEYREKVSSSYASRWGSFALGVYNGGGYHGNEENLNKTVQGRITVRPLPDIIPGLQLSGLAILGEGNQPGEEADETPDWTVLNAMVSYQHPRGAWTVQYVTGEGNQKGSWFEPGDFSEATDFNGFSLFGEQRFGSGWLVTGGFDKLERKPGVEDLSFTRIHGGIGYDLGNSNILLFDLDRRSWDDDGRSDDTRFQVVMQVSF